MDCKAMKAELVDQEDQQKKYIFVNSPPPPKLQHQNTSRWCALFTTGYYAVEAQILQQDKYYKPCYFHMHEIFANFANR